MNKTKEINLIDAATTAILAIALIMTITGICIAWIAPTWVVGEGFGELNNSTFSNLFDMQAKTQEAGLNGYKSLGIT